MPEPKEPRTLLDLTTAMLGDHVAVTFGGAGVGITVNASTRIAFEGHPEGLTMLVPMTTPEARKVAAAILVGCNLADGYRTCVKCGTLWKPGSFSAGPPVDPLGICAHDFR